ncbi:MAG: hypothetical protein IPK99_04285 [Flavobacteriales bacterium]|nr:hypothetical protein [Flavobacteriales bacterium]
MSFSFLSATQTSDSPYLDSLWQVYRTPGQDDHERLLLLHEIVDETRYENSDSARVLCDDLLRQAVSRTTPWRIALWRYSRCEARNIDEALHRYRPAHAVPPPGILSALEAGRQMPGSVGIIQQHGQLATRTLALWKRRWSLGPAHPRCTTWRTMKRVRQASAVAPGSRGRTTARS